MRAIYLLLLLAAVSCGREAPKPEAKPQDPHVDHPAVSQVKIEPSMMRESGIKVEPVMEQMISEEINFPARIVPTQNGIAHVGSAIPGRITKLLVSEGSSVGRNQALAVIESFSVGELKAEYLRSRAEEERNMLALQRQQKLTGENIGAERTLEETRTAYMQSVAARNSAETKLKALGISPKSLGATGDTLHSFSSRIILRSPIAGIVAKRGVALGVYIDPSADVFEIVNISTVCADAQVAPESIANLRLGAAAFVISGKERRAGRIIFISPSVDPETRKITVRVEAPNGDRLFHLESFVNVQFQTALTGATLVAPTSALETEGNQTFVYREKPDSSFERIEVEIGKKTERMTAIKAGLKRGERIATEGVFYLRSAMKKAELGNPN